MSVSEVEFFGEDAAVAVVMHIALLALFASTVAALCAVSFESVFVAITAFTAMIFALMCMFLCHFFFWPCLPCPKPGMLLEVNGKSSSNASWLELVLVGW